MYKIKENGEEKTATINTVKEFGVQNDFRYIKATVDIDLSSEFLAKLSDKRAADFVKKNVLFEGFG